MRHRPPTHVLCVSSEAEDHQALSRILNEPRWHISVASTCQDAIARLTWDRIAVGVCENNLADGTWRDLLRRFEQYAEPLTLIVASKLADERLWADVLNLGGYDVLAKPFDDLEVRRVLNSAMDRFQHQAHG